MFSRFDSLTSIRGQLHISFIETEDYYLTLGCVYASTIKASVLEKRPIIKKGTTIIQRILYAEGENRLSLSLNAATITNACYHLVRTYYF